MLLETKAFKYLSNLTLVSAMYAHSRCYEQPEAIGRALGFGGRLMADKITLGGLEKMAEKLSTVDFLTLVACGTSLNASRYAEKLMKHLGSFDVVHSIDAVLEFVEGVTRLTF